MKTKKIDCNSDVNQKIKGRFVEREVKACFSYEMDAVLKASDLVGSKEAGLPHWEDIENFYEYKCPECGEGVQDMGSLQKTDGIYECLNCQFKTNEEFDSEAQEIFEWWIVTEWLYEKLKAKGQPVLEWGNNYYWGRCTTGQAILLDGAISSICREMEILEGQANDWSK